MFCCLPPKRNILCRISKGVMKRIVSSVSKEIKSQQYVQNTYTIVKELIENSLDANAKNIKINLCARYISVEDDGEGIEDIDNVGKESYTGKHEISEYATGYATKYNTFKHGFRGQALFSIKTVSDLVIISRHKSFEYAYEMDFQNHTKKKLAREIGTTVRVKNLFHNSNLRKNILENTLKKDLQKILKTIKAYSYVYNVVFILHYEKNIYTEKGYASIFDALKQNYNQNFSEGNYLHHNCEDFKIYFSPRSHKNEDTQYIFHDKRYINLYSIKRAIGNLYSSYFQDGFIYIIILKTNSDFNCTIDKTEILLPDQERVVTEIKQVIERYLVEITSKSNISTKKAKLSSSYSYSDEFDSRKKASSSIKDNKIKKRSILSDLTNINRDRDEKINYSSKIPDGSIRKTEGQLHTSSILDCLTGIKETSNEDEEDVPVTLQDSHEVYKNNDSLEFSSEDMGAEKSNDDIISLAFENNLLNDPMIIHKSELEKMNIVGQFNNGFIITTFIRENIKYTTIIDQHAADEAFQFETLKENFHFKKLKLIVPVPLNPNTIEEFIIKNNRETIKRNGFIIDENMMLTTVPFYKNLILNKQDLFELIEKVKLNHEKAEIVLCKKIRDIMASKACRSSIMIGKCLKLDDMYKILKNLSSIKMPWKCPHGRPVMQVIRQEII